MPRFSFNLCLVLAFFTIEKSHGQSGPTANVVRNTSSTNPQQYQKAQYLWKKNITSTVFWVGEKPTPKNPTPNNKSSWDVNWQKNYGGYDNPAPVARSGYIPKDFVPKQNPFYIALPYNDVQRYNQHKPEASRVIPWFKRYRPIPGKTVCKGRWIQIYANKKYCYAQWEDCGPFSTTDWQYVFGNSRPKNKKNSGAGIDISPAVRDYLGLKNTDKVHWRFIEFNQVPRGPWALFGDNNPFVNPKMNRDKASQLEYFQRLRRLRDRSYLDKDVSRSK